MSFSPLNINSIGQLLQNQGLQINPIAQSYMGISEFSHGNYTKGSTVGGTVLNALTDAIKIAYDRNLVTSSVYDAIISIGVSSIGALGDSKPTTFTNTYNKEMSQWGWLRLIPWQAWREFYINNGSYTDFCSTFSTCFGKYQQLNLPINAANNSIGYLDKIYSNMNDLITADIAGVSLSTFYWGQDLIKSGRAIDLLEIEVFGNPDALLRNLYKNKAITQALGLALLSVGITDTESKNLSLGTTQATTDQQKLIYAAFCLVSDQDLIDILIPLNCQTANLTTLADLLDPKKLFPNSFASLTVPVYNSTPQPNNSKTYYLIYTASGGVNSQIGARFETRLAGILPTDIAQSCEAFAASMMQVRNIQSMNIEKFSQAVMNLENVSDLNVNNTNVPTNTELAKAALSYLALGTGEKGAYTMCDFFGAMTNIHYPHKSLTDQIIGLQTQKLFNIYSELRLAVSWAAAKMSVSQPYTYTIKKAYVPPTAGPNTPNPAYQPDPNEPDYNPNEYLFAPTDSATRWVNPGSPEEYEWFYTLSFSIADAGGGYGRGSGPAPTVTISPNNVNAAATVEIDPGSTVSTGFGTVKEKTKSYGSRYKWTQTTQDNWSSSVVYPNTTPPVYPPKNYAWILANMPEEVITIEAPPTDLLPVQASGSVATGGQNTPGVQISYKRIVNNGTQGWPLMNTPVQGYINQANTEIAAIQNNNPTAAKAINNTYKIYGTYLKKEQDARELALPNIEELTSQPSDVVVFVNGSTSFGEDTTTFGASNVLVQIYNPAYLGGRSLIGGLREVRNQARLGLAGGALDNDVNGTIDFPLPRINGKTLNEYITDKPSSGYLLITNPDGEQPVGDPPVYNIDPGKIPPGYVIGPDILIRPYIPEPGPGPGPIPPTPIEIIDEFIIPEGPENGYGDPPFDDYNLIKPVDPGLRVDPGLIDVPIYNGQPDVPGSFAGSPDSNLIPDNLSIIVVPSSDSVLTPDQAVAEVIRCNCDCWDEL